VEEQDHPATNLLKPVNAEYIWQYYVYPRYERTSTEPLDPVPFKYRFLFCNWGSWGCNRLLTYVGAECDANGELLNHVFLCRKCRGKTKWDASCTAWNANYVPDPNRDQRIVLSHSYYLTTIPAPDILEIRVVYPPAGTVYKLADVTKGKLRYTESVQLNENETYRYYARGLVPEKLMKDV
jgi:hypothetical protein